jgi:hypothetical protein
LWLITIGLGLFAEAFVRDRLIADNAATTLSNILANETLYRLGEAALFLGTATYLALTAIMYRLLAPVSRTVSLIAAFFSVAGCVIWMLALVGDASDGYPGLPGWGAKSAAAVLAKFGHLEAIPADWRTWGVNASRPGALAQTLERDRDRVLLFRDLATLRDDIPLFGSVDELKWPGPTPTFQPLAARLEAAVADPRPRELPRKRSV